MSAVTKMLLVCLRLVMRARPRLRPPLAPAKGQISSDVYNARQALSLSGICGSDSGKRLDATLQQFSKEKQGLACSQLATSKTQDHATYMKRSRSQCAQYYTYQRYCQHYSVLHATHTRTRSRRSLSLRRAEPSISSTSLAVARRPSSRAFGGLRTRRNSAPRYFYKLVTTSRGSQVTALASIARHHTTLHRIAVLYWAALFAGIPVRLPGALFASTRAVLTLLLLLRLYRGLPRARPPDGRLFMGLLGADGLPGQFGRQRVIAADCHCFQNVFAKQRASTC